jgi:hypothetical protein
LIAFSTSRAPAVKAFRDLHGFSDLASSATACWSSPVFTTAWRAAPTSGTSHALRKNRDEFVAFVKGGGNSMEAVAHLKAPGRNLLRVHGKFATIYAAGYAAIRFKILPFPAADLLEAVMTCERDHIAFIAKELGGAYALNASRSAAAMSRTPYDALKAYLNGPVAKTFLNLRSRRECAPQHVHAALPATWGYRGSKDLAPYAGFEGIAGVRLRAALKAELHAKGSSRPRAGGSFRSSATSRVGPRAGHRVARALIAVIR